VRSFVRAGGELLETTVFLRVWPMSGSVYYELAARTLLKIV
jgi:hypothetical protein